MHTIRHIIVLGLLLCCMAAQSMSVEREQQFTYYWYAAKQAVEKKQYNEALVLLEFCHQLNPTDGSTLYHLAVLYDAIGQKERAQQTLKTAYEADPKEQWRGYSSMLLNQRTAEGFEEALLVLEKAETVNPTDEDLLKQLVWLYMQEGEWRKALDKQKRLDQIKGYDAYSALSYYRIYAMWGKNKKAINALDHYLEQDPNNLQFLIFRLQLMEQTGAHPRELYALYNKILALDPHNLSVLNNYAYLLATHGGDLKQAERMSERTIHEDPTNPVYLDTYGWILHLQGQDTLALFYLKRAAQYADETNTEEIQRHIQAIENEK